MNEGRGSLRPFRGPLGLPWVKTCAQSCQLGACDPLAYRLGVDNNFLEEAYRNLVVPSLAHLEEAFHNLEVDIGLGEAYRNLVVASILEGNMDLVLASLL